MITDRDTERLADARAELDRMHAGEDCDGLNPMTHRPCVLSYHRGYHRDAVGAEWLEDE